MPPRLPPLPDPPRLPFRPLLEFELSAAGTGFGFGEGVTVDGRSGMEAFGA